jgi:hypothetical protein
MIGFCLVLYMLLCSLHGSAQSLIPSEICTNALLGKLEAAPNNRHREIQQKLETKYYAEFQQGVGGPGGWIIERESPLQFEYNGKRWRPEPDLAGWRMDSVETFAQSHNLQFGRHNKRIGTAYIIPPDWACEIVSTTSRKRDLETKYERYAYFKIAHYWIIDPAACSVHVFELRNGSYEIDEHDLQILERAAPFGNGLDLLPLWDFSKI